MITFKDFSENKTKKIQKEEKQFLKNVSFEDWIKWTSFMNMLKNEDPDIEEMLKLGDTFENAKKRWNSENWKFVRKQNIFISRKLAMRKNLRGNPFEIDNDLTPWLKSLLAAGHDPRKPARR